MGSASPVARDAAFINPGLFLGRLDRPGLDPYANPMTRLLAAALVALSASAAPAGELSPFAPAPKPTKTIVRLLAPSGAFNASMLRTFEQESGFAVAYDAYDPARAPALGSGAAYDVVVLPGPAVARAAAEGQLRRIDKETIPNARNVSPQVAAKLAAYDPGGFTFAWGWSPIGLIYDAAKAPALLGGPPASWAAALNPVAAGKLAPCGVALPDSRDELFLAAWRFMGANPARLRPRDVTAAADIIFSARKVARAPISRDPVSAIASGAVCLTFGGPPQAAIASRRSGADIGYALPREGGPIAIDAIAAPRDAPHPRQSAALIDFLLRPEIAAEATARAGLLSAGAAAPKENFRALWPVGLYDPNTAELVDREWRRIEDDGRKKPLAKAETSPKAKGAKSDALRGKAKPGKAKHDRKGQK